MRYTANKKLTKNTVTAREIVNSTYKCICIRIKSANHPSSFLRENQSTI